MHTNFFEFYTPTRLLAGAGLVKTLGQELTRFGLKRCFVVTDYHLRQSGLVDQVLDGLAGSKVEVAGIFTDVVPDSGVTVVEKCAESARQAQPDVLIAVGGGSVIDTAKAANLILTLGGKLLDYEGFGLIDAPLTPLVAIPTTAGSGSEVTRFAVIKDEERRSKLTLISPYLAPAIAVLDPEMTLALPASMTAATGMDALTHAVEAHMSTEANPVASGLALGAVAQIFANLPLVVQDGQDITARHAMLLAATMAGMAFSSTMVGVVHAAAHACGGLYGVPHGLANAILLSCGMRFNLPVAAGKLGDIARAAGVYEEGLTEDEYAQKAIGAVEELRASCGMTAMLRDAGVPKDGLADIAALAAVDGAVFTNPREADAADILQLLLDAY
jgi:alcohol dehydrogenase